MLRCARVVALLALVAAMSTATEDVTGKVCIITGASSGVGALAAKTFAKAGLKVVLTARRVEKLETLAEEIIAAGGEATFTQMDVTDDAAVKNAFDFAKVTYGGVDFVFANAGYNGNVIKPLVDKPADEITQNLLINTAGAIYTLRHAVTAFKERGGGTIVFSSSIFAHQNYQSQRALVKMGFAGGGALAYNAAKAGVDAVNRGAGQFLDEGVNSYSLQIAATLTEMSIRSAAQASEAFNADVDVAGFGAANPIFDTIGDPVHVGEVVLALFDGSSAWKPGQTIIVDNDGTADAAMWTRYVDQPLDTPSALPDKKEAQAWLRDVKGMPYKARSNEL